MSAEKCRAISEIVSVSAQQLRLIMRWILGLMLTAVLGVPMTAFLQQVSTQPDLSALDIEGVPGLILRDGAASCRMGWIDGSFGLEYTDRTVTVAATGAVTLQEQVLTTANLNIGTTLTMNGVRQWQLVQLETFDGARAEGWSVDRVTVCGGATMMGGYCELSSESTAKTFSSLPPHSQVRIVATYHFIDQWQGESAFLRSEVNGALAIVWTDRLSLDAAASGYNVCGSDRYPEMQFASLVDVTLPHARDSLQVEFGSTLDEQSCTHSYGVSGFQLYVR